MGLVSFTSLHAPIISANETALRPFNCGSVSRIFLCPLYTDQYAAYSWALPQAHHWANEKKSGATAHIERWNNTLRQRLARFVRKTLSFSKSDQMHQIMLEWFIIDYNLAIKTTASLTL